MTKRYLTIPAVVAGAMGLSSAAHAGDPQPTTAELMKQIDQLQSKVQKMEEQQKAEASQGVDDTVERVLRDADKRSQLMQMEGFTAGWNEGRFMIASVDGNWTLMPFFHMQFRNSTNFDTGGEDDNTENGFSLPRVKVGVDGNVFTKNLTYMLLWNSGDSDGGGSGGLNLEQAWVRYQFADQWAFRAGQFIDPLFHEQLTGSQYQLAADRSLMNTIITGADESYTQGVTAIWNPSSNVNVEVGFTDGINTGNTSFRDFPNGPANFGFAGRVDFTVHGDPRSARDFTAMGNKEDLLVIGGGADWTQSGDTDNVSHTVDVQWETGNLGMYAAYVGQFIRNGGGSGITGVTGGDDDSYNWGILVQAGYMLDQNWEVFGRYDWTELDDQIPVGAGAGGATEDTFHELTGGVNYYFSGHNAKATFDVTWLLNGAPQGASNLGILNSDDNEFVIRGQLQLML